jgi:hypothetical protein
MMFDRAYMYAEAIIARLDGIRQLLERIAGLLDRQEQRLQKMDELWREHAER